MNKAVLSYLKTQRVCVLAVEMLDGSPHAATVHFAHIDKPLVLYFETNKDCRKAQPILKNKSVRASLVVGSDESNMQTLQMDGLVEPIKSNEMTKYKEIYLDKFPGKIEKSKDAKFLAFKFTPTWWRFTDWTTPKGKIILNSK